jgi:hypothetical protein
LITIPPNLNRIVAVEIAEWGAWVLADVGGEGGLRSVEVEALAQKWVPRAEMRAKRKVLDFAVCMGYMELTGRYMHAKYLGLENEKGR